MLNRRNLLAVIWGLLLSVLLWPFGFKFKWPQKRFHYRLTRFTGPIFKKPHRLPDIRWILAANPMKAPLPELDRLRSWPIDIRHALTARAAQAMNDENNARVTAELFQAVDQAEWSARMAADQVIPYKIVKRSDSHVAESKTTAADDGRPASDTVFRDRWV